MTNRETRRMKVIPEPAPDTRSVLVPTFKGPAMKGNGALSYTCGSCDTTLFRNMDYKAVQGLVVKCGGCGSFNEIPLSHHTN